MTYTLPAPSSSTVTTTTDHTTVLSQIRMKIGDTVSTDPLLTDEHILEVYANFPTVIAAAVECVKNIIARMARDADFSAGVISVQRSPRFQQFKDLLVQLEAESETSLVVYVGGQSKAIEETYASTEDLKARVFRVGMDRNR